jgi:hypothetical protein
MWVGYILAEAPIAETRTNFGGTGLPEQLWFRGQSECGLIRVSIDGHPEFLQPQQLDSDLVTTLLLAITF